MATRLTIPEWTGAHLTNGAFLDYAERSLAAYVAALVEEYKGVASQFKGKKKDAPAPEPSGEGIALSQEG